MQTEILSPTPENIEKAAKALREGELVAIPTETVYGLAGNAFSPEAVAKIFETKERPTFDPLIVHVSEKQIDRDNISSCPILEIREWPEKTLAKIQKLARTFWPGPLTLVLPKSPRVPDLVTSGLNTVGIRMPKHPVTLKLLDSLDFPLAAPSANRFGRISPTTAQAVLEELGGKIRYILDGGRSEVGIESTVLWVTREGKTPILRPGAVTPILLEKLFGEKILIAEKPTVTPSVAPGMLESHYAPMKACWALPENWKKEKRIAEKIKTKSKNPSFLLFSDEDQKQAALLKKLELLHASGTEYVRVLSPDGILTEAAHHLFQYLRELDSSPSDSIWVERVPGTSGLARAINDRLKRASKGWEE